MKTIILICKGILLWATSFLFLLYLSALESMVEQGHTSLLYISTIILLTLLILCYINLNYKDVEVVSGAKWFSKIIK